MTTLADGIVVSGPRVVLREKRLSDAADDYRWRTRADLARYDAARPLTATFQEYQALYREELVCPSPYRRSLAIEDEEGRHIGNLMYYNIDPVRSEAELGITIGEPSRWGQGYGTEAVRLALEYLLGRLSLRRIYLKTLTWNRRARRCFEKAGFVQYGRTHRNGNSFVLMEFRREWLAGDQAPQG